MPVDRLYTGTEPIAHPITGELIELDDREALFKAWTETCEEIRRIQPLIADYSKFVRKLRKQSDEIVYALAGQDVTRTAAREWARDQTEQGD